MLTSKLNYFPLIATLAALLCVSNALAAQESRVNTDPNYNPDPTLFKGAANNIWI